MFKNLYTSNTLDCNKYDAKLIKRISLFFRMVYRLSLLFFASCNCVYTIISEWKRNNKELYFFNRGEARVF